MQLNNTSLSLPIEQDGKTKAIDFAFKLYMMGELDEKTFIYFCLLNNKIKA